MPFNLPSFEVQTLIKTAVDSIKTVVDSIKITTDVTKTGVENVNSKQDSLMQKIQNGEMKRNIALFDKPGTYTWKCPDGVNVINLTMFGGGGSGAVFTVIEYPIIGGGGGGGAYVDNKPIKVTPGTTYSLVVGPGGPSAVASSEKYTAGKTGGATSAFGITCNGGSGGNGTGSVITTRAKGNSPLCNKGTMSAYAVNNSTLDGQHADGNTLSGNRFGLPGIYGDRTYGGGAGFGDGGDGSDRTTVAPGAGSGGVNGGSSAKGGDGIIIIEY